MISYAGKYEDLKAVVTAMNSLEEYINNALSISFNPELQFNYRNPTLIEIKRPSAIYSRITYEYDKCMISTSINPAGVEARTKDFEALANILRPLALTYFKLREEYRDIRKRLGDEHESSV